MIVSAGAARPDMSAAANTSGVTRLSSRQRLETVSVMKSATLQAYIPRPYAETFTFVRKKEVPKEKQPDDELQRRESLGKKAAPKKKWMDRLRRREVAVEDQSETVVLRCGKNNLQFIEGMQMEVVKATMTGRDMARDVMLPPSEYALPPGLFRDFEVLAGATFPPQLSQHGLVLPREPKKED